MIREAVKVSRYINLPRAPSVRDSRYRSNSTQRLKKCRWLVCGSLFFLLVFAGSIILFFHSSHWHLSDALPHHTLQSRPAAFESPPATRSYSTSSNLSTVIPVVQSSHVQSLLHLERVLAAHPLHELTDEQRRQYELEDYMEFMHKHGACVGKPIFTSMANVYSDLYWQMIENFVYTMVKFDLSDCTLMVCVSDPKCMQLCAESNFPCYDFRYDRYHPDKKLPHALEQIGELKLLHLPKALARGVDMMMLDLDVGFLEDPNKLLSRLQSSKSDIFVQRDIAFVMNRTRIGWRTWYTVPLPNIGIFLCRGNEKTVKMFEKAWRDYQSINKPIKHNPGKDQNKVVEAMRIARYKYKLRWEYFPRDTAVLLDKIYKFDHNTTYELGGEAADRVLHEKGSVAVHTTCYEQKAKVTGLKAANAFWNPRYYNPLERTITKPLVLLDERQLRFDVRALLYLAYSTNRSLILPNILGNERDRRSGVQLYNGRALWPGFRVAFFKNKYRVPVKLLEPAFYWRIARDYLDEDHGHYIPSPMVVPLRNLSEYSVGAIEMLLHSDQYKDIHRLVLDAPSKARKHRQTAEMAQQRLHKWADDSVGLFDIFEIEARRYRPLPLLNDKEAGIGLMHPDVAHNIVQEVRLCDQVMRPNLGNRSCFDKCD